MASLSRRTGSQLTGAMRSVRGCIDQLLIPLGALFSCIGMELALSAWQLRRKRRSASS